MSNFGAGILTVITAIIGVALLAVILSKNAQTASVIQAASSGLSSLLNTVLSPINGQGGLGSNLGTGLGGS